MHLYILDGFSLLGDVPLKRAQRRNQFGQLFVLLNELIVGGVLLPLYQFLIFPYPLYLLLNLMDLIGYSFRFSEELLIDSLPILDVIPNLVDVLTEACL